MNLVALTALIAVCGAAKLDRTYLPPASAKTAGGSPGSLQTPFSRGPFNNGLGGLPKGSYENEFQGVVVDADAAGTRVSGVEASGLGAPRISYGSTDSRVGAAAFKTKPSAFAQPAKASGSQFEQAQGQFPSSQEFGTQGSFQGQFPSGTSQGFQSAAQGQSQSQGSQGPERPRAALDRAAGILRYENEVGPESYHFAFETDNGITAEENGVATDGVKSQGGFSYTGDDGQVYSVSYTADEGGYQPRGDHLPTPPPIPEAILKSLEQNAKDEAAGVSDDGSYDAQKYNAGSDYSENDGENGKFAHQSSKFGNEADATASGTFVSQSNQPFRQPGQRGQAGQKRPVGQFGLSSSNAQTEDASDVSNQSADFGQSSGGGQETNAQSGTGFSGQFSQSSNQGSSANRGPGRFGQTSVKGQSQTAFGSATVNKQNGIQSGSSYSGQFGQTNKFQSSNQGFPSGQFGQSNTGSQGQNNAFGTISGASSLSDLNQGFGNRNEYLPPKPSQNGRPQPARPQNGRPSNGRPQFKPQVSDTSAQPDEGSKTDEQKPANFVPLGQQDLQSESRPEGAFTSFGKPVTTQKKPTNGRRPPTNDNFDQTSQTVNGFNKLNEYLPPSSNGNRKQSQIGSQATSVYQQNQQASGNFQSSQSRPQTSSFTSPSESQSTFGTQSQSSFGAEAQPTFATQPQQTNGFQKPQSSKPSQAYNRFPSQSTTQFGASGSTFGFNKPVKTTSQPDTELTTPFETSYDKASPSLPEKTSTSAFASSGTQPSNGRPAQSSVGGQFNSVQSSFGSQLNPRPTSRPFGQSSAFPAQSLGQASQNAQFGSQFQSPSDQNADVQFASSTQRPSYTQQPQGPDDSYYYKEPSKPFGTPQGSRFPNAPSNQFDGVNQQKPFGTPQGSRFPSAPSNQFDGVNQQSSVSQSQYYTNQEASVGLPSGQFPGSTKYPQAPTVAPVVPTNQAQSFISQNQFGGQSQGSSKYPRPPTVAPMTPSSSQFQGSVATGVTQAAISSFPPQSPTQTSQFGSRPSFPQSQTSQFGSQSSTFGSKPTQPTFGQKPSSSTVSRPGSGFQSQTQSFGQQTQEQEANENQPEQPVATQQYTGEIYEYNKPAQTLPPPDSTPASSDGSFPQKVPSQGQFGAQPARPQFGQTNDDDDQKPVSQFGSQVSTPISSSRPQFGAPSRPQNSFSSQSTQQISEDSKPYGALAQSVAQSSKQPGSRPQLSAQFPPPQFGQPQATGVGEDNEDTEFSQSNVPEDTSCCKTLPSSVNRKPAGQSQFSQNFAGSQTFKPQPTSSFAGQGEQFGGPRPPPSFDDATGYHY